MHDSSKNYHLLVSGARGSEATILQLNPFTDLPGESHKLYANLTLAADKGQNEIDKFTHNQRAYTVKVPFPCHTLEPGDIIGIDSTRHNCDVLAQIITIRTKATVNSFISTIKAIAFQDVKN